MLAFSNAFTSESNENMPARPSLEWFGILVGMFGLGSSLRNHSLEICSLGCLLRNFRLGSIACELRLGISFGIGRFDCCAKTLSLGRVRFGASVWGLSREELRLITCVLDPFIGSLRLKMFTWTRSLGESSWELGLEKRRL